jgi:hypothetical protein
MLTFLPHELRAAGGEEEAEDVEYGAGDLLLLGRPGGQEALLHDTCHVTHAQSGATGLIPSRHVHVLPCCAPPDSTVLVGITQSDSTLLLNTAQPYRLH